MPQSNLEVLGDGGRMDDLPDAWRALGHPTDVALQSMFLGLDPEAILSAICAVALRRLEAHAPDREGLRRRLKRIFQAGVLGEYGLCQLAEDAPALDRHDAILDSLVIFVPLAQDLIEQSHRGFDASSVALFVERIGVASQRSHRPLSADELRCRLAPALRQRLSRTTRPATASQASQ